MGKSSKAKPFVIKERRRRRLSPVEKERRKIMKTDDESVENSMRKRKQHWKLVEEASNNDSNSSRINNDSRSSRINSNSFESVPVDCYGDDYDLVDFEEPVTSVKISERSKRETAWTDYGDRLVELYQKALSLGYQLYQVEYCDYNSLAEILISMQMLPSSSSKPKVAIHFGLLEYLHVLKMEAFISNHAFTNVINFTTKPMTPLSKNVLNNVYYIYRRIVNHSTGLINNLLNIKSVSCFACEKASDKMITLDGNFQLKRELTASSPPPPCEGIFAPSLVEHSVWGSKEEVDAFSNEDTEENAQECPSVDILDSSFRATSNNARNINNRFDEKGVFSMSCARHGVPERLFDIYGGEGSKYALAAINHVVGGDAPPQSLKIMYDIACRYKKRILRTFPVLSTSALPASFAVTAFHAYAHSINCQVDFHPRYMTGYGLTDEEGCERFWSYLNGFVSMTRSMTKQNRRMLLADAVMHFTENKMANMLSYISKKYQQTEANIQKLHLQEEKFNELNRNCANIKKNMSIDSVESYIDELKLNLENDGNDTELVTVYYSSVFKLRSLPLSNDRLISGVRSQLEKTIEDIDSRVGRSDEDDEVILNNKDKINQEVVGFLRALLNSYV